MSSSAGKILAGRTLEAAMQAATLKAPTTGTTRTESVLYSFGGGPDGSYRGPASFLILKGDIYSTTGVGTTNSGVVFELTPPKTGTVWIETPLWTFTGGNDGGDSTAGLAIKGTTLYGTTSLGGQYSKGTVFEVIP